MIFMVPVYLKSEELDYAQSIFRLCFVQSAKIFYDNLSDDERLTRYLTGLPSAFSGMARVVWSTTATPIDKLNDVWFDYYPNWESNLSFNLL